MKIHIFGFGNIGYAVADALSKLKYNFLIIDKDPEKVKIARKLGYEALKLDLLKSSISNVNFGATALPGPIAYEVVKKLLMSGINLADVSFYEGDIWELENYISNNIYIPDAGFAPGITNVMVGYSYNIMGGLDSAYIYVGGLSYEPDDLLGLALTWSPVDLIDEYIREASYIEDGKVKYVDPFARTGVIDLDNLGKFEYFITDGLRTLINTFYGKVREMYEFTLRYPGHLEKMYFLRKLGILTNLKSEFANLLTKVIENKYRDRVIMYVKCCYEDKYVVSKLCMTYSEDKRLSAMAITTGYPLAVITSMIFDGIISGRGIYPPEYIGMNKDQFNEFMNRLEKLGIKIQVNLCL